MDSCPLAPKSGHVQRTSQCLLCANSGHRVFAKAKDQRAAHKGTTHKEAPALQLGLSVLAAESVSAERLESAPGNNRSRSFALTNGSLAYASREAEGESHRADYN